MNNNWLAASNFERMHQIISAINIISVNEKLRMALIDEQMDEQELQNAREELVKFLKQLNTHLEQVKKQRDGLIVGDDPRLGELTVRYLANKGQLTNTASLYNVPLGDLVMWIETNPADKTSEIITCLNDLRTLLEQLSQADVHDILGDI